MFVVTSINYVRRRGLGANAAEFESDGANKETKDYRLPVVVLRAGEWAYLWRWWGNMYHAITYSIRGGEWVQETHADTIVQMIFTTRSGPALLAGVPGSVDGVTETGI